LPLARSRLTYPFAALAFATAATVAGLVAVTWLTRQDPVSPSSVSVRAISGAPAVQSRAVAAQGSLPVGGWLTTGRDDRAAIEMSAVGRVEIQPDSRLGLVSARPGDVRMHLSKGTMQAVIWSPPGQFAVTTPTSTAVDLGCIYAMQVDEDGVGFLQVAAGWVGFEWRGRESFIPAGAAAYTRPGLGPGTPHYEDTPAPYRTALETIDLGSAPAQARAQALEVVLRESRRQDVLTLWHLLSRVDPAERDRVYDRLAAFVTPPASVTREGIRAGDRAMLDAWWDALDLGTSAWWRIWIQQWRDPAPRR
jgi:hypothetical protein